MLFVNLLSIGFYAIERKYRAVGTVYTGEAEQDRDPEHDVSLCFFYFTPLLQLQYSMKILQTTCG